MDAVPLAKDALHIHIALAIFVAVRLLWRRRGGWWLAWAAALAAALAGEYFDLVNEGATSIADAWTNAHGAHWQDIWNGMAWPTILLLVGRWLHPPQRPTLQPANAASSPANNSRPS